MSPVGETTLSESVEEKVHPSVSAGDGNGSSIFLERNFELMELLTELPSIAGLLAQAARTCLGEDEREVRTDTYMGRHVCRLHTYLYCIHV